MFTREELERAEDYCERNEEGLLVYHCQMQKAISELYTMKSFSSWQIIELYIITEKIFLDKGKLNDYEKIQYEGFIKYFKALKEEAKKWESYKEPFHWDCLEREEDEECY